MTWNKRSGPKSLSSWMLSFSLVFLLALTGCSVYSFSGTNIDPSVKSISISTFQNTSNNGPSSLSQRFTEDFKDYFQRNTSIKQVPRDGDLQFEGEIIAFDYAPAAIQQQDGRDQAGVNRLTIQVRVKFTNTKDPTQDFEQTFQQPEDFPATQDIASINNDPAAVRRVTQRIITDVFNKSVANW
ncbi:LPS assembly lipoprotein LptE [Hymenobacter tibetensis]|uniref:LPS assembly lipoprotein LptE n=1 Tax=Hymenobacter tibetensis TaxID=497967 RepID=A0ABY4CS82_9BACT|nr:LptE family protein [Hymenobacter tibetensis]UOG72922.1 LPS assembly lipoprotein LptE [Hymenobacter tibetensis]